MQIFMRHAFYIATDTKKILSILKGFPLYVIFVAKEDLIGARQKFPPTALIMTMRRLSFLLIYLKFLLTADLIVPVLLLFSLIPLSIFDIKFNEISNGFILYNLVPEFVSLLLKMPILTEGILSIFFIPLPIAPICVFNNQFLFGSDAKLLLSVGGILGFRGGFITFISSVILCGISGVILVSSKSVEKQEGIPFSAGSFLSAQLSRFVSVR